ncbi:MAG: hypothetical protein QM779_11070 [Propionicimonas sp.]|uniref:hypothetical protein n=1 Tax=Propionicimonas sp. TaxID=1955623 RepID=UPI003D0D6312
MASTSQIIRALMAGDRLALVIALNPKAADVIPRGPLRAFARGIEVELNPQPLPPGPVEVGVRLMQEVVRAGITTGFAQFADDIDDWCGTGWPHRWPGVVPIPDPDPEPWYLAQVQLGGLLALADIAAHYGDAKLVARFDEAIEKLGDAAIGQAGQRFGGV